MNMDSKQCFSFNVFLCAKDDEEIDPMLEQYKDFLFAPDELPVYVAAPKASQMSNQCTIAV